MDIAIYTMTVDGHLSSLTTTLRQWRNYGFKIEFIRCNFLKHEINFCGNIVSVPDPQRTSLIDRYRNLENREDVQWFLGFASPYRRFVVNWALVDCFRSYLTLPQTFEVWTYNWNVSLMSSQVHITRRFHVTWWIYWNLNSRDIIEKEPRT